MKIEIIVSGGTDKTVRFDLNISDAKTGELQVDRRDFTKLCDLLFKNSYVIGSNGSHQAL